MLVKNALMTYKDTKYILAWASCVVKKEAKLLDVNKEDILQWVFLKYTLDF